MTITNLSMGRCIAGAALACVLFVAENALGGDEAINEEARRHFSAGVALLQDPDGARYEDAYREFEAAYSASLSPKILGNIGFCAMKLERDDEAITAYSRYLAEVHDVDPAEAAQIARDVATLRAGLVRVTVTLDAREATIVDKRVPVRGETVTNVYGPAKGQFEIGLRPGHHVIEARLQGGTVEPWDFDARPGASLSHAFSVKRAAEARGGRSFSHPVPWMVTGIGAATLAAGAITGVMTLDKVGAIASNCPNNQCPPTYALKPAQDDARRFRTVTDTLLIGGGVIAATGVYLLFSMSGSESPRPQSVDVRSASAKPSMSCSPLGCVASLSGTF